MPALGDIQSTPRGYRIFAGRAWFPAPPSLVPDAPRLVRRELWTHTHTRAAADAIARLYTSDDPPDSPAEGAAVPQGRLDGTFEDVPVDRGGPTPIEELPRKAREYLALVEAGCSPRGARAYLRTTPQDTRAWAAASAEFGQALLRLSGRQRAEDRPAVSA